MVLSHSPTLLGASMNTPHRQGDSSAKKTIKINFFYHVIKTTCDFWIITSIRLHIIRLCHWHTTVVVLVVVFFSFFSNLMCFFFPQVSSPSLLWSLSWKVGNIWDSPTLKYLFDQNLGSLLLLWQSESQLRKMKKVWSHFCSRESWLFQLECFAVSGICPWRDCDSRM